MINVKSRSYDPLQLLHLFVEFQLFFNQSCKRFNCLICFLLFSPTQIIYIKQICNRMQVTCMFNTAVIFSGICYAKQQIIVMLSSSGFS